MNKIVLFGGLALMAWMIGSKKFTRSSEAASYIKSNLNQDGFGVLETDDPAIVKVMEAGGTYHYAAIPAKYLSDQEKLLTKRANLLSIVELNPDYANTLSFQNAMAKINEALGI